MFDGLMKPDSTGQGTIQRGLEAVRRHLGMEVAYVSRFEDGRSVFREVDAPGLEALIRPGDSRGLDEVYCLHILAGRLPELIPDTAAFPLATAMPITQAVPIGAHVSVPIRMPDGRPYGMFCCLSPRANPSLNDRDLQVMRVFAEMAGHAIAREVAEAEASRSRMAELETVMEERLFTFRFQPILTLQPLQVVGFEALCRFGPEPYRTPDLWFAAAHAAGCGVELELAVLQRAVQALRRLKAPAFLSLNAAPATILSGRLPKLFAGLPTERLVLEVTEHSQVEDYDALRAALAPLRSGGVKLAIDDAGAGYSSLQHILQLQPDIIKLDMGLVRGVDQDPAKRALAAALCFFARETGCQIVAEGIETEAEFAALEALGVSRGQGYLLGRPGDLAAAQEMVGAAAG
ncbi:EAL domain-containing protein [Roseomonas frigidaquae]|uniref:EAL domain-containing protein n=1 Tax=Falsiroseomonas frigidaquae TaxID=487318 RepID=A0ABX1F3G9_9PROT|nr:EAL domain-containing protein [Falsiroseomonas frigidaquae]NKE46873.1 EAL domain-containing protein [Falsiroseomonas frigidaquae]